MYLEIRWDLILPELNKFAIYGEEQNLRDGHGEAKQTCLPFLDVDPWLIILVPIVAKSGQLACLFR